MLEDPSTKFTVEMRKQRADGSEWWLPLLGFMFDWRSEAQDQVDTWNRFLPNSYRIVDLSSPSRYGYGMQTFLPYRKFESSARVLDNKRLGKQRVETLQIMKALVLDEGWVNHAATRMWRGFEYALMSYQEAVCDEWAINRGFNDNCLQKTADLFEQLTDEQRSPRVPAWLGLKKFHSPHRANLLRKDPLHYGRFGWKETPTEGYFWPVREDNR